MAGAVVPMAVVVALMAKKAEVSTAAPAWAAWEAASREESWLVASIAAAVSIVAVLVSTVVSIGDSTAVSETSGSTGLGLAMAIPTTPPDTGIRSGIGVGIPTIMPRPTMRPRPTTAITTIAMELAAIPQRPAWSSFQTIFQRIRLLNT